MHEGLRVLHLSPEYPPVIGGIGDHVDWLTRELSKQGLDVRVLTSPRSADYNAGDVAVSAMVESWDGRLRQTVAREVETFKPDVLHIHYQQLMYQGYPAIGFLPWSLRGRKTAVVTTVHDMQRPARTSRAIGRLAFEALLYGSDRLLVNGEAELRRLAKRPMLRARSTVLPNGSNILVSAINAEQKRALRASVAPDDAFLLGFFGLVRPGKGLEVLLDAIARLRARPAPVELLVIGAVGDADPVGGAAYRDGLLDQRRRLGLEESVKFLGHLPEAKVSELLQVCDLGVLPFDTGAFTGHTSVFAALSHGLPLLTTQGSSTEAVFTQGAMSLVPAPPEPKALADAIYTLMKGREKRESIAAKGRELTDRFSRPELAARVAEIYAGAVRPPATAASNTANVR